MKRKWRWYLGLAILLLITGIPTAVVKSIGYLISGMPKHAVAEFLYLPLNWADWFLVTIPTRIEESPVIGVTMLLGTIAVLSVSVWLIAHRRKHVKRT